MEENSTTVKVIIINLFQQGNIMFTSLDDNTCLMGRWVEYSPMAQETRFNPRLSHTKDKNDTWYLLDFNWNHFEMRLLNLRIHFFNYCRLFVLILVVFRYCGKITWRRPAVKFGQSVMKEETIQKLPRWGQNVRNR